MKNFILFALCGLSTLAIAQNPPTIGEIFDYEIGYEFHSTQRGGVPVVDRLTVIDKQWSAAKDTVFYTFIDNGYAFHYYNEDSSKYVFRSDTITKFYTNLGASIYDLHLNDELPKNRKRVTYFDGRWNGDTLDTSKTRILVDTFTILPNENCKAHGVGYNRIYGSLLFEPSNRRRTYIKGAGMISDYLWLGEGTVPYYDWELFYYKMGEIECGTPDRRTSVRIIVCPGPESVEVFPNPCTSFITVLNSFGTAINAVSIYSTTGELVWQQESDGLINTSHFAKGSYLIEVKSGDFVHRSLFMKE